MNRHTPFIRYQAIGIIKILLILKEIVFSTRFADINQMIGNAIIIA